MTKSSTRFFIQSNDSFGYCNIYRVLAVGVTFAFLNVDILYAIIVIGLTTFCLSIVGVKIGHVFGIKYKSKAEIAGGIILILMGIKILLEHLGLF